MIKRFVETGKIVGTHGIKGEMRVQPWADSPKAVADLKHIYISDDGEELELISSRVHSNIVLIKVNGIDTVEQAEKMRNKIIFAKRDDVLKNGGHLVAELIGCSVVDADTNEIYGEISDVFQTGANDVWTVKNNGREYYVPAIDDVVIFVDVEAEKIEIRPIKGIFDDEN